MDTQGAPTIALDPAIHVVYFAPFAHCDRLAILAGHARQTALLIQLTTIRTAVGGIDKAIRQSRGILAAAAAPTRVITTGGQERGAQPELCIGGCARNRRSCSTWPRSAAPQKTGARCMASCCVDHSPATAS